MLNPQTETFRDLHTMKGTSRVLGLTGISDRAHSVETLVQAAMKGDAIPEGQILAAWDELESEFSRYQRTMNRALACYHAYDP